MSLLTTFSKYLNLPDFYHMCCRKEVSAMGLTVLVDARRCSPVPALFKAFNILQVRTPLLYNMLNEGYAQTLP